ncbi:DUF2157 domain-containing protein [Mucilaginibacter myungsuensis]|uniref:DUF2157 domain-containing protein n=1 Tax=Mucilaginibacter myungsuensis TaxID=649104 RepID=A0A929L2T5_9SPHI|nr:DUF2157 domain-containing protein [Mucilaginibacter myungsuensis]MBE9662191.1 DUF2157 domain-containing protein [Mucilaginibacter myungsuensis]MDN3599375.1 DUF2157 domain-containing protein [Mucilaginibacter myungsuensis]
MTDELYQNLHVECLISDASLARIQAKANKPRLFSVHWEVKTLLYIGILALTGGLGLLVYEHIDTIGHQAILLFIALICVGSFAYGYKKRKPFSAELVKAPNPAFDYVILLGSISMLTFLGYLQYQYNFFGTNYGLATFIPMLALFFIAYRFDHLGILSMAIANLALWMGVSVTPKKLLLNADFDNLTIIYTYLVLGCSLLALSIATQRYNFKKHFKFSYQHYGIHVCYVALLAGYFHNYDSWLAFAFVLGVGVLSVIMYLDAFRHRSFYFILIVLLYSYVMISSLMVRLTFSVGDGALIFFLLMYFVGSAIGFIFLLMDINKKLKAE